MRVSKVLFFSKFQERNQHKKGQLSGVPVRCGARNAGEHENFDSLPQWQRPSNVAHDGPCISAGNSSSAALPCYLIVKITTQLQSVHDCT